MEEAYDSKSPVHNEDAFEHGITFNVKVLLEKSTFVIFVGEMLLIEK